MKSQYIVPIGVKMRIAAVETADLDSTAERPVAVAEREAPDMGVATETAPTEAPIELQAMTAKTLPSTSTIPTEERGETGAGKPTIG
jgi:hypothetical protein